jgi:hypothetical protein
VCAFDALSLHSHRARSSHNIKSRKLISLPEKLIKGKCYSAAGRSKRKENALARAHTAVAAAAQHQKAAEMRGKMYVYMLGFFADLLKFIELSFCEKSVPWQKGAALIFFCANMALLTFYFT